MACPVAKAERSKAKDLRQGVKDQRARPPKARGAKQDKPVRVYRYFARMGGWSDWGKKFATVEQAEAWIAKEMRSGYWTREDFRLEGQQRYSAPKEG